MLPALELISLEELVLPEKALLDGEEVLRSKYQRGKKRITTGSILTNPTPPTQMGHFFNPFPPRAPLLESRALERVLWGRSAS